MPGGGGGVLGIYIGGGVPWHTKKGGSYVRHNIKRGGGIRCGYNQKGGGGLRCVYNPQKGEFRTGLVNRVSVRN